MIYQKASTGFRIGASVGIIILMLGIAMTLSVFATVSISNQMKVMIDFNAPLEKTAIQMNNIQKNKENAMNNAIKFLQMRDSNGFQILQDEFYGLENQMTGELIRAKELFNTDSYALSQEYLSYSSNSILTKMNEVEKLNTEYEQTANDIFALSTNVDKIKSVNLVNDLRAKGSLLTVKQNDLLNNIESFHQSIEVSVDETKQRFLTLELVIVASAGVISLTSGHFVNQINKDLQHEVIKKTKSLQKVNEKLRKLNMLKDEFINEASHELKSPLNPIYGFVELAKCGDIDKEEALSGIAKQARQIEEVANKMLDLGKIDSDRLRISVERFNLNELILEISEAARINLNENVSIRTDLRGSIEVDADKVRIGQVIRNILNNAIKFTHEGHILVTSSSDSIRAEVKISDTGIGIHPDVLPKLFNKFVTKSHKKENLEGSGLGLYLCKGIIDAHNGELHAYNNHDCGATIFFSIPLTSATSNNIVQSRLHN